eukprot:354541-Chlamydomonas_euryale.AAC.3
MLCGGWMLCLWSAHRLGACGGQRWLPKRCPQTSHTPDTARPHAPHPLSTPNIHTRFHTLHPYPKPSCSSTARSARGGMQRRLRRHIRK